MQSYTKVMLVCICNLSCLVDHFWCKRYT